MEQNWFAARMPDEVSYDEILANESNFHHWDYEAFDLMETGYEEVEEVLKGYSAEEFNKLSDSEKERVVDEVLAIYRKVGTFPNQYYSDMGVMQEIEKCIAYNARFEGDTVSCGAGIGTALCNFLFPNIHDVPSLHDVNKKDAENVYKRFYNDKFLRKAIAFCFTYKNGCPTPANVMSGVRLVGSAPSNFRPMNAKAVYERFCPEGGTIWDPCCVDVETEFFNGKEWKYISDYVDGDKVLQYNEEGTGTLVYPEEYIHYKSDDPFFLFESPSLSSALTGNHDVVVVEEGKLKKYKQNSILDKDVDIPVVFTLDGSSEKSKGYLKSLIIEVEESNEGKVYPNELYALTLSSKLTFISLLLNLGYISTCSEVGFPASTDMMVYLNKSLENRELVSFMFHSTGEGSTRSTFNGELIIWKNANTSAMTGNGYTTLSNKKDKYCFVVPSHMLILRRRGSIFITGNCGFGGRLLGALSSKKNFRYVGTDPCTETMYNLHRLAEYIEMTTGRDESYELHCCGSEVFRGPANSIDFAFTSPPYFNLELYSDEDTQCFNKFPVLEDWLEGYVRGTIKNVHHMLKPGRYYAINIADFKVHGGEIVAYVDEWIRISEEEGMPLFDTVYLGVTARAGSRQQQFGEKKKENILIFKKPL